MTQQLNHWLAAGLVVLAAALAVNAILGPLALAVITYPFSETLVYQTISLEAVTLGVVVPWSLGTASLLVRGHRAARVLAIPPTGYAAYMFVQYILGPAYLVYRPVVLFHLLIFLLSTGLLVLAWHTTASRQLPTVSGRRTRYLGWGVIGLGVFVVSRYIEALIGMVTVAPLSSEFAADPTMFWSIVLLDLGIVAPIAIATGIAVLRGADWGYRAAYAVVGWYVLVPISVAAMAVVMYLNDDPNAALANVVLFSVVAVVFTLFAAWVYRPLFGRGPGDGSTAEDPVRPRTAD